MKNGTEACGGVVLQRGVVLGWGNKWASAQRKGVSGWNPDLQDVNPAIVTVRRDEIPTYT